MTSPDKTWFMNPTIIVHQSEAIAHPDGNAYVLLQERFKASFGLEFSLTDFDDRTKFHYYQGQDQATYMVEYVGGGKDEGFTSSGLH